MSEQPLQGADTAYVTVQSCAYATAAVIDRNSSRRSRLTEPWKSRVLADPTAPRIVGYKPMSRAIIPPAKHANNRQKLFELLAMSSFVTLRDRRQRCQLPGPQELFVPLTSQPGADMSACPGPSRSPGQAVRSGISGNRSSGA
jgi:hypothetical protein